MGRISVDRTLGNTEPKYKIITAGKSFALPRNAPVTVVCNGGTYPVKTHSITTGRIDGLADLYRDASLKVGDRLRLTYDPDRNTVSVERLTAKDMEGAGLPDDVSPAKAVAPDGAEKPYIFISYSRKDAKEVEDLLDALRLYGYRIRYDRDIPACAEWQAVLDNYLSQCTVCLAFLSKAYVESRNCRDEASSAYQSGKEVLPVFLEDTKLEHGLYWMQSLQYFEKSRFQDGIGLLKELEKEQNKPLFSQCLER